MIDKGYAILYELYNGFVETGSDLQYDDNWSIEECLDLPAATGVEARIPGLGDTEATYTVTKEDLKTDPKDIVKAILNRTTDDDEIIIAFDKDDKTNETTLIQLQGAIVKMLNKHNKTQLYGDRRAASIKNKGLRKMLNAVDDPANFINESTSVDTVTGPLKDRAKNTEGAHDKEKISYDDFTAVFRMQSINMVGKSVIGITAVSMKGFYAASAYYNGVISDAERMIIEGNIESADAAMKELLLDNPLHAGCKTVYANLNFGPLLALTSANDLLYDEPLEYTFWNSLTEEEEKRTINSLHELLKAMDFYSSLNDCAFNESGVLTLATDNAKELQLAALNATPGLVDIYTAGLSIGNSFEDIADIMTSKIFGVAAKLTEKDATDAKPTTLRISNALNCFSGKFPGLNASGHFLPLVKYASENGYITGQFSGANWQVLVATQGPEFFDGMKKAPAALKKRRRGAGDNFWGVDEDMAEMYAEVYADMLEGMDLGEEGTNRPGDATKFDLDTITLLTKAMNAFKQIAEYRESIGTDKYNEEFGNITTIANVVNTIVETQQILGGLAGINQGIKSSNYDKYKWRRKVEQFYKKYDPSFDLKACIKGEQEIPDVPGYNPLKMLLNVPHYKAMLESWAVCDDVLESVDSKYVSLKYITDGIGKGLTNKQYKKIENAITDQYILSWLTTSPITISGLDVKKYGASEIQLSNLDNIAKFKEAFESEIIPDLKKNSSSVFIKALRWSAKRTPTGIIKFLKLDLPMNEIDEHKEYRERYYMIAKDFERNANTQIPSIKYNGKALTWGEAFFLYNLIVNKEQAGPNSLTRIFEVLINKDDFGKNKNLMTDYYQFLIDLDSSDNKLQAVEDKDFIRDCNKIANDVRLTVPQAFKFSRTFNLLDSQGGVKLISDTAPVISHEEAGVIRKITLRDTVKCLVDPKGENPVVQNVFKFYNSDDLPADCPIDPELMSEARAFVYNGQIYINTSKASVTDALHEWMHVVLAKLKWSENESERKFYYDCIDAVKKFAADPANKKAYERIAYPYIGKGFGGSDLLEEVFVSLFQKYANGYMVSGDKVYDEILNIFGESSDESAFSHIIMKILDNKDLLNAGSSVSAFLQTIPEVKDYLVPNDFNDSNIDWIRKAQTMQQLSSKVNALRTALVENESLTIECHD